MFVLLPDDQFLLKCLGLALEALDFTLLKSRKANWNLISFDYYTEFSGTNDTWRSIDLTDPLI